MQNGKNNSGWHNFLMNEGLLLLVDSISIFICVTSHQNTKQTKIQNYTYAVIRQAIIQSFIDCRCQLF